MTNTKSSPLELQAAVPYFRIPFVPIIQKGEEPFSMFNDLYGCDRVLDLLEYDSVNNLVNRFEKAVIEPALEKRDKLMAEKAEGLRKRYINDYPLIPNKDSF
jgi:hypothetical protein